MTPRALAAAAMAALLLAARVEAGDETTVFRCVEPGGRVLYTDIPCRGANVVELHPGKADPAAAQLRAYAQSVLDAGMERRRAEEAQEAARFAALADARAAQAAQAPAPEPVAVDDTYWPAYGFIGPVRPRPHPPIHKPPNRRPPPPANGPRPPRPMPVSR